MLCECWCMGVAGCMPVCVVCGVGRVIECDMCVSCITARVCVCGCLGVKGGLLLFVEVCVY